MTHRGGEKNQRFLGIEGGATRTVALLADSQGKTLRRLEAGPANLKLLTDSQLTEHLFGFAAALPRPDAVAIGLAGAWAESDKTRIRLAAGQAWPGVPCFATHDLETALAAANRNEGQGSITPQVLILSGTGSACYGKDPAGKGIKVGGWGHLLGDHGSGYEIGLRALQASVEYRDRTGKWPALGQNILRQLNLAQPRELIDWVHRATKGAIARLAEEVFASHAAREKLAAQILKKAACSLAQDGALCARKVARPNRRVDFVLSGGVLLKQPRFAAEIGRELRRLWPGAVVKTLQRESVWGAVELAKTRCRSPGPEGKTAPSASLGESALSIAQEAKERPRLTVTSMRLSPTEQRNPRSRRLDKLPLRKAIRLMLTEEGRVPRQVLTQLPALERSIRLIASAFQHAGRLFYVGAGTSGRLGVLDASECPPTFGAPSEQVQGIIAGGRSALWASIEGAEDDAAAGAAEIKTRRVSARDVVVGIAASGTTPFVWGAIAEAKRRRARTVLVCFNPFLRIPSALRPNVIIAPDLGPEVLTGSTRLKAGTATKLILNSFTTLSMVRLGKVMSNLMIDLRPTNTKLRQRAVGIVQELTGASAERARQALEAGGWSIKKCVARLGRSR